MPVQHGKIVKDGDLSLEEKLRRQETKSDSKYFNPCAEAASRSMRCMHRNNGDKTMCSDYFQAYRDCRQEWQDQLRAQKRGAGSEDQPARKGMFAGLFGGKAEEGAEKEAKG